MNQWKDRQKFKIPITTDKEVFVYAESKKQALIRARAWEVNEEDIIEV